MAFDFFKNIFNAPKTKKPATPTLKPIPSPTAGVTTPQMLIPSNTTANTVPAGKSPLPASVYTPSPFAQNFLNPPAVPQVKPTPAPAAAAPKPIATAAPKPTAYTPSAPKPTTQTPAIPNVAPSAPSVPEAGATGAMPNPSNPWFGIPAEISKNFTTKEEAIAYWNKPGTAMPGTTSVPEPSTTPPGSEEPETPTYKSQAAYDAANKAYQDSLKISPDELSTQEDIDRLLDQAGKIQVGRTLGLNKAEDQAIPMEFITGQQASIERSALGQIQAVTQQAEPLERKLARLQAARTSSLDASKFALERASSALETEKAAATKAQAPMEVSAGNSIVKYNPKTGKYEEVYTSTKPTVPQSITDKYGSGSIGEYNFYAEQERAAGRTPKTFSQYQDEDANRKALAAGNSGGLTPYQTQQTINQIAGQFDNEPVVRNYNVVAEGYQFANSLLNKGTPSSSDDQGLLYAFAKAMDPNSVVREGEYATVQKYAQSWAQSFGFNAARIFSNTPFLTQEAKQNMVNTIKSKYEVSQKNYDNVAANYQRRIQDAKSGIVGGSITDYSAAYKPKTLEEYYQQASPQDKAKTEQMIKENPSLSDDDILQILNGGFSQGSGGTPTATTMRTDRHNNPTAFTTDLAKQAGLREGIDYVAGDPFPDNPNMRTALLKGDPIETTIKLIDRVGFYTAKGQPRWTHTAMPQSQWNSLSHAQKAQVISKMYQSEGGTQLAGIFNKNLA